MVRREEKKQIRKKDAEYDDPGKVGFNPQELRTQRYAAQDMFSMSLLWSVRLLVCFCYCS